MKKCFLSIIAVFITVFSIASHIAGGELIYEYIGKAGNGMDSFKISLRLFRDCHSDGAQLTAEGFTIGIYSQADLSLKRTLNLGPPQVYTIQRSDNSVPCLTSIKEICFQVGTYSANVNLPRLPGGYILAVTRCCRPNNMSNLSISTGVGATYVTTIPGTNTIFNTNNSSAQFTVKDTALICESRKFILEFGAKDPDRDSLSYAFCDAFNGASAANAAPPPASTLTLNSLSYKSPFSGNNPLGVNCSINPSNGIITGSAPAAGRYVINVCATEWRAGQAINVQRKEFILEIVKCDSVEADISHIKHLWCDTYAVNFSNNTHSSGIRAYKWDFGNPFTIGDTSTAPAPKFTYPDTGRFLVKLTVLGPPGCSDTDSTLISVFPGCSNLFIPGAFTPNSDGKNDILHAIGVGVKKLSYFKIYNRFGQLIFSTTELKRGWDGTFGGKRQPAGSYAYLAEAVDYQNNILIRKGITVLIR